MKHVPALNSIPAILLILPLWLFTIKKKIPVSSVGKFRMGRILFTIYKKILIMESVFHFFTKSASVAPGRDN